ncbi:S8 family serine peptidase [Actinomadura syzygii]|uniref:S8 family serine peptidase n=1 Tax=Actinomadura syzygii TaxID=1427538 RepID=A0A5D0TNF2_9ACTN|nr:S8 family serine peptidase [Actinomadura syzygii]TYC07821.1 S8 family serine peptidase [Actinomadura syzygii]
MTRLLAAMTASSALVLTTAMPATAAPRGREDEWWFSAWAIEKKVWPISKGAGVTVAVVDNGVNGRIPDLEGVLVPGTDVTPAGGDGQIGATSDLDDSHGTGMAGLIASQGTSTGYVGVAPEAKIMSVKSDFSVWDKAIRFAADHGAKVISISQAFAALNGCRPQNQEAVAYALQRDVVVVVGAGNEGDQKNRSMEPANCAGALVVGAVDNQKRPWVGTERQSYVVAAAPGDDVNALQADGRVATDLAGTSQATALTAAVVALVRAKYPHMSAREVVRRITNTTVDVGPPGRDNMTGYGVVVPHAALTANVPKSAPNPVFAAYDRWMSSHPVQPSAVPSVKQPKTAAEKSGDQAARNTQLLVVGLVAAGLLGVVFVVFLVVRAKRRAGGVAPVGGAQQYGPPPGWGGAAGAPPPLPPTPPGQQGGRPYVPPNGPGGTRPPN